MAIAEYRVTRQDIEEELENCATALRCHVHNRTDNPEDYVVDSLFNLIGLLKDAGWDVDMIKDIWDKN